MDTQMMVTIAGVVLAVFVLFLVLKKSITWIENSLTTLLRMMQGWAERTTAFAVSLFRPQSRRSSPEHTRLEGSDLEWLALGLLSFSLILCSVAAEFILLAAVLGPLFGLEWSFAGAHFDWIVAGALLASICVFGDTLLCIFSGKKHVDDGEQARKLRDIPQSLGLRVCLALMSIGGIFTVGYVVLLAGKMRAEALFESSMEAIASANGTEVVLSLALICFLAIAIDVITSESLRIVLRLIFGVVFLVGGVVLWGLAAITYGGQLIAALIKELIGAGNDGESVFKLADDKGKSFVERVINFLRSIFGEEMVTTGETKDVKKPATSREGDFPSSNEHAGRNVKPVQPPDPQREVVFVRPRVADVDPEDRELVGVAADSKKRDDRSQAYQWDFPG
ncbi:MAG TPA: hypothetical protein PKD12_02815 [Nitrospira sp.]|nr:hypothetical protein [Nitrospira sp.]